MQYIYRLQSTTYFIRDSNDTKECPRERDEKHENNNKKEKSRSATHKLNPSTKMNQKGFYLESIILLVS